MDLQAFFKMSYGLYIVSSAFEGRQNGCVVNTVAQVTAEPPKAVVSISKKSLTCGLIRKSGVWNAAPLTERATMELIGRFGFQQGEQTDKYNGIAYAADANGVYYPTESVAALFSFKVLSHTDLDTHMLFVGEAVEAKTLSSDPVMTYDYYHRVKKGGTPPNAPSYKKPASGKGWRCKVCGFVYEGDELPQGYVCPVCKKGAKFFERL